LLLYFIIVELWMFYKHFLSPEPKFELWSAIKTHIQASSF
jgi:hypothetical protein